jgi:toxin CcdB
VARLDVYPMPEGSGAGYVVDIQNDFLERLRTRVVVPLLPLGATPVPIRELNPVIDIGGVPHVFVAEALSAVPLRALRSSIGSLKEQHDTITRALDILFVGY